MHELLKSRGKKPRTGIVRACEECGKEMYVRPAELETRRYCSNVCRGQAQQRRTRTTCVTCGQEFVQAASVGGKYCSRACYLKDREPRKTCKTCGVALSKTALTYCSTACMWQDRRTLVTKTCTVCGADYTVKPSEAETSKYCSRACKDQGLRLTGPGARTVRQDGYISVYYPTHPDADTNGRILEHRLVAEQKYGRRILPTEQVHHINGVRADNRPENLEVLPAGDHTRQTIKEQTHKRRAARTELEEYRRRFGPLTS